VRARLGIVGGLGPGATVFYYMEAQRLCLEMCGRRPRLLLYSLPLEEMCRAARRGDLGAMAGLVVEALEALAAAGARVALVSANTPHLARGLYAPRARELGLALVDIVEASVGELRGVGARRVGLLATSATLRSRLYHGALEAAGMEPVEPPPGLQERLDRAIAEEFTAGSPGPGALEALRAAASSLLDAGVDAVLVACTDLSPHVGVLRGLAEPRGAAVVDSAVAQLRRGLELAYRGRDGG
jgi:aspartate racemase